MIKSIFATGLFLALTLASVKLEAVLPEGVTVTKEGSKWVLKNNSTETATLEVDYSGTRRIMDGFAYKVHGRSVEIPENTPEHIKRKILEQHLANYRQYSPRCSQKPYDWSSFHRFTRVTLTSGLMVATRLGALSLSALIAPAPVAPLHPDMGG